MYRAQYDIGFRNTARGHAVLCSPSRVLVTMLSFVFLLSVQLCYAMAHDMPSVQTVSDCSLNLPHYMDDSSMPSSMDKSAPVDHGAKAPNACVMMICGCVVQLGTNLRAFTPVLDFGLPPLVAALSGKMPNRDLRPPILLPA
ncbi:hypothetical protein ACWGNA_13865 [Brucella cytisi]|uniref:hypothetical protein n=1 Tax=Brucella cytisi TaxID=407152 RepID=UPI0035DF52F9